MAHLKSGRGWSCRTGIILILLLALMSTVTWAQLSADDIKNLQDRARAEGWTFTVGENPATQYPLEDITGLVEPPDWRATAKFDPCADKVDLPATFDWREITGCPPIRNQKSCGSCWAFATAGALECNVRIKDGIDVDLSEQWLVSCNQDGWGCDGGWFAHDYHQWKTDRCGDSGAVLEPYFPYTATDQYCECPYPHDYYLENWAYIGEPYGVPSNDAMKQAIMEHGPISISLHVGAEFQAYNGGIFTACGSGSINHAVVLVGWDDTQGYEGVWFLRNSWGPGWGENGYMRIKFNCADFGTGACYVDYHRARKIALVGDQIWEIAGGDGDSIPEAGETVRMALSFENRFESEVTDVTARLFFDDASLNITQGTAFLGNILPDDTVTNLSAPFEFEIPAGYIPRTDSLFIEFTWDGGAKVDTQSVERVIGGVPVLIVDDDNGDNIESYYTRYLDSMRVPYQIFSLNLIESDFTALTDYPIVFWITGDYQTTPLNRLDIEMLMEYLNHPGSQLFLTGQHIAGQLNTSDPDFLHNYLKADYLSGTYIPVLGDSPSGNVFLPDDTICFIGGESAGNQTVTEQIAAINGGVPEFNYINSTSLGAVSYSGDYKLLFFSFGFEGIVNGSLRWTPRDTIFTRIVDFFGLQRPASGPEVLSLTISPGDPMHMIDPAPTFAWTFSDPASQPQQYYQIQLSDDKFWLLPPLWDSGPVAGDNAQTQYSGIDLFDGTEYYIRVRASNGNFWSDWRSAYMRTNSVPVPTGLNPDNMATVTGDHPTLSHDLMTDNEGDSLVYVYELYDDSDMTTLLANGDKSYAGNTGTAVWQVPLVLTADEDYFWRVRAADPFENGQWSDLASFYVMSYIYGDANGDGEVSVGDVVYLINYIFRSGPPPEPLASGDANCDGQVNAGDPVFLIAYIFRSGPAPGCSK